MTTTIGVRDIARNINLLQNYDYLDIEDKKTKEYKGLLVAAKYADEIKSFLEKRLQKERQKELDEILQFSGIFHGETKNMSIKEIKAGKIDTDIFADRLCGI